MDTKKGIETTFRIGGDLEVNRMGFGAMRITGEGIWGPPADRDGAIAVLKRAVELGINFIDTADSYGPNVSEELIAEALHPYKPGLVIATKGGLLRTGPNQWPVDARPDHLKEALEGSLQRLRLDRIELYQLHRIDPKVPAKDSLNFLKDAQRQGLIRHIGLSEVSVEDIEQAREIVDVVSVQNMYSVDNRKWEPVLEYCERENIAFIPWYPLNAGNVKALKTISDIADRLGVSTHQVALSWLFRRSNNILLIPGTSKSAHLEQNVAAVNVELTADDMNELNALAGAEKS